MLGLPALWFVEEELTVPSKGLRYGDATWLRESPRAYCINSISALQLETARRLEMVQKYPQYAVGNEGR